MPIVLMSGSSQQIDNDEYRGYDHHRRNPLVLSLRRKFVRANRTYFGILIDLHCAGGAFFFRHDVSEVREFAFHPAVLGRHTREPAT